MYNKIYICRDLFSLFESNFQNESYDQIHSSNCVWILQSSQDVSKIGIRSNFIMYHRQRPELLYLFLLVLIKKFLHTTYRDKMSRFFIT